jgi:hypothetical protein
MIQHDTPPEINKLAPDEVSVKGMISRFGDSRRYLGSKWKIFLIAILIGAVIGLAYSLLKKISYTAECTFVLEEGDKGGAGFGQYSALASMVGIDVGSTSGLFQGDNITQLYKSRLMLQKTLFTEALFKGKAQLLIDRYIESNKLRETWKDNPHLGAIDFHVPKEKFTMQHDSLVSLFANNINEHYLTVDKPDKKLTLISVKVKSTDALFAKAFTEKIVENVNSFYVQSKTKRAMQNVALLQHQSDSVRRVLNTSLGRTASAMDDNPNATEGVQSSLKVSAQRHQVDVQASSAIYAEVTKDLEIARGTLQKETPLIQVIDEPVLPLPNDRAGKLKSMLSGMLIAAITTALWLFTLRVYKRIMN